MMRFVHKGWRVQVHKMDGKTVIHVWSAADAPGYRFDCPKKRKKIQGLVEKYIAIAVLKS